QVAALVTAVVLTSALLVFFKYSRMGLAMRAAAFDQEVALTQGVSVAAVFALSWALSAVFAMFGGVFVGAGVGIDRTAADRPESLARGHRRRPRLHRRSSRRRPDHRHRRDAHLDLSAAVPPTVGDGLCPGGPLPGDVRRPAGPTHRPVRHRGGGAGMRLGRPG